MLLRAGRLGACETVTLASPWLFNCSQLLSVEEKVHQLLEVSLELWSPKT